MTVKIASVKAFLIASDLTGGRIVTAPRRPAWTASAEVAGPMSHFARFKKQRALWRPAMPSVGCLVTAEDGSWGFGASRYGNPVASLINEHIGPLLVGENTMATEQLWDMMQRLASPYGAMGLASYAISAVDYALWDLKGKILRRPVFELLGGPAREKIACYATGNDTDWHMELGFAATKLACPFGPTDGLAGIDGNEALVARTRDLIGPKVELMLDCWMAFDTEFTVRLAERLKPYGLRWIEDCLMPDDMDGWDVLRRRLPWQALATGEHWYGLAPFLSSIGRRNVDVFQPDVAWVGGVTATVKICHLAEAAGVPVIPHAAMNSPFGQHVCYAMPNIPWGEFFLGSPPGVPLSEVTPFPGQAVPKDGALVPNDGPGFGLGLTLDDLERLKV
jgi:L-rhamnonate dehydratase